MLTLFLAVLIKRMGKHINAVAHKRTYSVSNYANSFYKNAVEINMEADYLPSMGLVAKFSLLNFSLKEIKEDKQKEPLGGISIMETARLSAWTQRNV